MSIAMPTYSYQQLPYIIVVIYSSFHPKTSFMYQKRHPYSGNVNSETSADSKNVFVDCGDDLGLQHCHIAVWRLIVFAHEYQ